MITAKEARKNVELYEKNKEFYKVIEEQIRNCAENGGDSIKVKDVKMDENINYFVALGYSINYFNFKDNNCIVISW